MVRGKLVEIGAFRSTERIRQRYLLLLVGNVAISSSGKERARGKMEAKSVGSEDHSVLVRSSSKSSFSNAAWGLL